MPKRYKLSLHIFRRDLRLQDNTALLEALACSDNVIPCFIFDTRQLTNNEYRGDHCVAFMRQSLIELNEALTLKGSRLYYFEGTAEDVVARLLAEQAIDAVFINRDYTPFSLARDKKIEGHCRELNKGFHCFADALLNEPEQVHKADRTPYTVYTPYRNKAIEHHIAVPTKNDGDNYYHGKIKHEVTIDVLAEQAFPAMNPVGGRREGIALLKAIKDIENYALTRNIPALDATTKLSAHHKFGTVSIRETYHMVVKAFGKSHQLLNELYWRDFFTQIGFHFPRVYNSAFHEKYNNIAWTNNTKQFKAWCEGKTGFPIVDAGMRELNATGYMHNRVRMITASFLTKDLHIDWRWGEKYFAQLLVDYDPAVNNGNWQWAASTGCDAQPYFRIFNPWLQQKKFDPDCTYIKRFVPELAQLSAKAIHDLEKPIATTPVGYPRPIISHATASAHAKTLYKAAIEKPND